MSVIPPKMELLAPAGSPEALDAAVGEGADAVYLGLKNFNARMRSANFTWSQFEAALRSLRRMGKKIYVTVNTVFEQREADRMYQLLKYLSLTGPDALIVQDFGVIAMVRAEFPLLKIHASTQMNIASARGANALSRHGVSRVVLARELSLTELRSIRADTNMELEVFVHGALCVSASGICLFSSYLGGKSANRGMCTQACRRLYHHNAAGSAAPESGYYFSPGDLQLLEGLPDLAAAGINAIKIEGRMKSADYVGTVVSAYRLVLDAIAGGCEEKIQRAVQEGQAILRADFARRKTRFYFDTETVIAPQKENAGAASLDWLNPCQDGGTGISLGTIQKIQGSGDRRCGLVPIAALSCVPSAGDSIRLHRSDDSERVSHKITYTEAAADGGYWISIPDGFGPGDRVYLIQTKAMSKRYEPVIARNVAGHSPGREKAPPVTVAPIRAGKDARRKKPEAAETFPAGLYAAVSRIEDLYIVQSSRPGRVILSLNHKTLTYLLADNRQPLPFKPAGIILELDPFFPEASSKSMTGAIGSLIEQGYRQFMVNNLGHFSLFRGHEALLIAGPWLYIFNSWAFSFAASFGVAGFVSPLENNRQNLERTLLASGDRQGHSLRSMFFIPVFAWPPLFSIRADLGPAYDFNSFQDSRGENFSLITSPESSMVIPWKPFSIIDKIPYLQAAGFHRFIIDLRGPALKKADYRDLMRAVDTGSPLPRISRFNWKDGFYQNKEKE